MGFLGWWGAEGLLGVMVVVVVVVEEEVLVVRLYW